MTTTARRPSGRGNTSGQYSFARIPSVSTPRSTFDRSCGLKTTFSSGDLVPIFTDEALPGDTFSMQLTTFARMATPLHPIMDNLKLDTFFFAVPIRLIWDNFQKFMGEQDDPGDSTDFLIPTTDPGPLGMGPGTVWDYFGLPIQISDAPVVSALHFRALNLIWNEWFRDQNLQDSLVVNRDDGPDDAGDYFPVPKRGKRHDYFTSCLPWAQKGPAVELPLGLSAPVTLDSPNAFLPTGTGPPEFDASGSTYTLETHATTDHTIWSGTKGSNVTADWDDPKLTVDIGGALGTADLSSATAATINQIREAFQIQKLYEKDARGGTRYTEILRSHFGVESPDSRLQRPEYLGGGTTAINVSPIPQTSRTVSSGGDESPQGNLAAYVTSTGSTPGWIKSFTEHCVILGFACVRADLNYQQRLDRMWTRSTRWDFYWPSLAHLGEQTVLNQEINFRDDVNDEDVFGYQERWAEYRYKPSTITGKMRSPTGGFTTSLDTWHLAQDFDAARPLLNAAFIEENPPVDRVIAVVDEPEFLFDAFFAYRCTRPMPTYSVPGLIDHF